MSQDKKARTAEKYRKNQKELNKPLFKEIKTEFKKRENCKICTL